MLPRCADMSTKDKSKSCWHIPLVIIPPLDGGEPPSMFPYLVRTVLAFREYGPDGAPQVVCVQPSGCAGFHLLHPLLLACSAAVIAPSHC